MNQKFLFFDMVVLSNFAVAQDGIVFLKERYRKRGIITLQVLQEIAKVNYADEGYLYRIENSLLTGDGFQKLSLSEKEQDHYIALLKNLGEGEASCIAAAIEQNAIVVTDDRVARNFCKERNMGISGTLGILKAACLDHFLQPDQANKMLAQMIVSGFYSPVHKITDIL